MRHAVNSILAMLATVALLGGGAHAQEVVLRLHHFLPLQATIPANALAPWIAAVEASSNGRIRVEHYPSMQLGGAPPALFDQARDGVVDLAWTVLGYTPGRFPKTEAFELPFMVTTGAATSRAFHAYVEAYAADEFAGVRPLVLHTHGPGVLHVRGDGVARLEDLQGLTLRGPTRITTRLLERLGATAVGMPVPAVPEALSKGVIDGVLVPWEVTPALRIAELVDSHTELAGGRGLYTATFALVMNEASYAALPSELQAVIDAHSGVAVAEAFGRAMDEGDVVGREAAVAAGNGIQALDEAEVARWQAAAAPIVDDWIGEMDARGIDGAGLVEAARRLIDGPDSVAR